MANRPKITRVTLQVKRDKRSIENYVIIFCDGPNDPVQPNDEVYLIFPHIQGPSRRLPVATETSFAFSHNFNGDANTPAFLTLDDLPKEQTKTRVHWYRPSNQHSHIFRDISVYYLED